MDSLTQICLGAAVGEVCLGKKVGNHAILWGAILGTVPDLDVLFKPFFDMVGGLVMHRGFSHSMLFFILGSPVFGYLIQKIYKDKTTVKDWVFFSFWVMFTHAILDCFTSWGTQLFWPMPMRVAWNNIFVADLLYTLPLLICLIWLMFIPKSYQKRRNINYWGIGISSLYMLITIVNKNVANSRFESELENQGIEFTDYSTRPTPLNSVLWDAVAEDSEHFYMGYYSLLSKTGKVKWTQLEKNHHLMYFAKDQENWEKLKHFMNHEYIIEKTDSDTLNIHDLRFGRIEFPDGSSDYVFTFYAVQDAVGHVTFTQKELPSEKFDTEEMSQMFSALWNGIKGNEMISE